MDKVVSARLDADIVERMDRASKLLGISKRQFLEEAIAAKAKEAVAERDARRRQFDEALRLSFGAWKDRPESTEEIIAEIKRATREMMDRRRQQRADPDLP